MKQLGIEMIPAYSPEARGRSERAFATHQGRLPKELVAAGLTTLEAANRYLEEVYRPAFNAEFQQPALEEGSAFVPWIGVPWMTSSVSSMSALWAMTTVCASKGSRCRSHRTGIAVTTSR